eukprot:CFRG1012T1
MSTLSCLTCGRGEEFKDVETLWGHTRNEHCIDVDVFGCNDCKFRAESLPSIIEHLHDVHEFMVEVSHSEKVQEFVGGVEKQSQTQLQAQIPTMSSEDRNTYNKPCRFGDGCKRADCKFIHKKSCRYGETCPLKACKFSHDSRVMTNACIGVDTNSERLRNTGTNVYKCKNMQCDKEFVQLERLHQHVDKNHGVVIELYKSTTGRIPSGGSCRDCKTGPLMFSALQAHVHTEHGVLIKDRTHSTGSNGSNINGSVGRGEYDCISLSCDKTFKDWISLRVHVEMKHSVVIQLDVNKCTGDGPTRVPIPNSTLIGGCCLECNKRFDSFISIQQHLLDRHDVVAANTTTNSSTASPIVPSNVSEGSTNAPKRDGFLDSDHKRSTAITTSLKACRFGRKCFRWNCEFSHDVPSSDRDTQRDKDREASDIISTNRGKPCRYGCYCKNTRCTYSHLESNAEEIIPYATSKSSDFSPSLLECGPCDRIFRTEGGLLHHKNTKHGIAVALYPSPNATMPWGGCCNDCNTSFLAFGSFEEHLRVNHGMSIEDYPIDSKYKWNEIREELPPVDGLPLGGGEVLDCQVYACDKSFKSMTSLWQHISMTHCTIVQFGDGGSVAGGFCIECTTSFDTSESLQAHLSEIHSVHTSSFPSNHTQSPPHQPHSLTHISTNGVSDHEYASDVHVISPLSGSPSDRSLSALNIGSTLFDDFLDTAIIGGDTPLDERYDPPSRENRVIHQPPISRPKLTPQTFSSNSVTPHDGIQHTPTNAKSSSVVSVVSNFENGASRIDDQTTSFNRDLTTFNNGISTVWPCKQVATHTYESPRESFSLPDLHMLTSTHDVQMLVADRAPKAHVRGSTFLSDDYLWKDISDLDHSKGVTIALYPSSDPVYPTGGYCRKCNPDLFLQYNKMQTHMRTIHNINMFVRLPKSGHPSAVDSEEGRPNTVNISSTGGPIECKIASCRKTFSDLPGLWNHVNSRHSIFMEMGMDKSTGLPSLVRGTCCAGTMWFDSFEALQTHVRHVHFTVIEKSTLKQHTNTQSSRSNAGSVVQNIGDLELIKDSTGGPEENAENMAMCTTGRECKECGAAMSSFRIVRSHLRYKHDIYIVECEGGRAGTNLGGYLYECKSSGCVDKRFKTMNSLWQHVRQRHYVTIDLADNLVGPKLLSSTSVSGLNLTVSNQSPSKPHKAEYSDSTEDHGRLTKTESTNEVPPLVDMKDLSEASSRSDLNEFSQEINEFDPMTNDTTSDCNSISNKQDNFALLPVVISCTTYPCDVNTPVFDSVDNLCKHVVMKHNVELQSPQNGVGSCKSCRYQFFSLKALQWHLLHVHWIVVHEQYKPSEEDTIQKRKTLMKCKIHSCGMIFVTASSLINHIKNHHWASVNPVAWKYVPDGGHCGDCIVYFRCITSLRAHLLDHHRFRMSNGLEKDGSILNTDANEEQIVLVRQDSSDKVESLVYLPMYSCVTCHAEFLSMTSFYDHMWVKHKINVNYTDTGLYPGTTYCSGCRKDTSSSETLRLDTFEDLQSHLLEGHSVRVSLKPDGHIEREITSEDNMFRCMPCQKMLESKESVHYHIRSNHKTNVSYSEQGMYANTSYCNTCQNSTNQSMCFVIFQDFVKHLHVEHGVKIRDEKAKFNETVNEYDSGHFDLSNSGLNTGKWKRWAQRYLSGLVLVCGTCHTGHVSMESLSSHLFKRHKIVNHMFDALGNKTDSRGFYCGDGLQVEGHDEYYRDFRRFHSHIFEQHGVKIGLLVDFFGVCGDTNDIQYVLIILSNLGIAVYIRDPWLWCTFIILCGVLMRDLIRLRGL